MLQRNIDNTAQLQAQRGRTRHAKRRARITFLITLVACDSVLAETRNLSEFWLDRTVPRTQQKRGAEAPRCIRIDRDLLRVE